MPRWGNQKVDASRCNFYWKWTVKFRIFTISICFTDWKTIIDCKNPMFGLNRIYHRKTIYKALGYTFDYDWQDIVCLEPV